MNKEISYTEAVTELENIVSDIENDDVSVDELGIKVKRASELITICKNKLHHTEEEVSKILKEINE